MLIKSDEICMILVDVQEKLIGSIDNHERVIKNCRWLIQLSEALSLPLLVSEQYPRGLGHTISALDSNHKNICKGEKTTFSCAADDAMLKTIQSLNKKQVLLMGIEAHVCVLQTALELKAKNFDVFVVTDAIGSRHDHDYLAGIERMRQAGIILVTCEMVFFECVRDSKHPEFKTLSQQFLQTK